MTAQVDHATVTPWTEFRPLSAAGIGILLAGAAFLALLVAAGGGPMVAAAMPAVVMIAFAALGMALPWLYLLIAFSGIGLSWAGGSLALGGYTINVAGLQWGSALVSAILLLVLLPARGRGAPSEMRLYLLFVALAVLGVGYSPSLFEGIKHVMLYAMPLAVGFVVLRSVRTEQDIRLIRSAFIAAFVLGTIIGVASLGWVRFSGANSGMAGALGNRAHAIFLLPIHALFLAAWRVRRGRYGWLALATFLLIVLTLSRMATLVAALMFMAATIPGMRWGHRAAFSLLAIAALAAVWQFAPLRERMFAGTRGSQATVELVGTGREAQVSAGINLSGRGLLWLQTWRHARQEPTLGHGTGSATHFLATDVQIRARHPHNDYLRVFHDSGIVGLMAVVPFMAAAMLMVRRYRAASTSPLATELAWAAWLCWLAYVLMAVTDNVMVYASFFTQNLFALTALAHVARTHDTGEAVA